MTGAATRFAFRFDPVFRPVLALLGVRPATTWVAVTDRDLVIRYGPWRLRTDRENVTAVELSGPYRWWRVIGPHLSLADGGASFGSSTAGGICLRFGTAVPAVVPGGWPRHPAATVTIADPPALARVLAVPDLS
ncbi:PH domain-containing protein [Micromonospora sp. DT228]|uniref:PH domain-containing protein n=1 Tax=Micromonospora sp. DT228 TaxID=3393443 RepID=UPI003CE84E67